MFHRTHDELKQLGADTTTSEIMQQPELWRDTFSIYRNQLDDIETFLSDARSMADGRLVVIFTGAGTSDYVGDTCAPYLRHAGDTSRYEFKSIATTDIVSAPLDFVNPDDPTLLVSFARSGNSPESLAAIEVVRKYVKQVKFLNITCAPNGKLAIKSANDPDSHTVLIPRANDGGFAMTGSYTCMELLATLIFDDAPIDQKESWVSIAAEMGEEVILREHEIAAFLDDDFNRVTYLGSGSFGGLAQEAQLKILELAHGLIATSYDTSMGYRHGPKSFVDSKTLVFVFVSENEYTRQYDLDILNEIDHDKIAQKVIAIQQKSDNPYSGISFTFDSAECLPESYLALPFVMVAQTVALLNSIRVGNTPDTPSPNGTVNRVVKGVTIHPFNAQDGFIDDAPRIDYMRQHLAWVLKAIDGGVNVDGYFVWSLQDQFSWTNGYNKRYGLFYIDFETQERYPKASAYWYKNVAETGLLMA